MRRWKRMCDVPLSRDVTEIAGRNDCVEGLPAAWLETVDDQLTELPEPIQTPTGELLTVSRNTDERGRVYTQLRGHEDSAGGSGRSPSWLRLVACFSLRT
jgi:hypothetical protein